MLRLPCLTLLLTVASSAVMHAANTPPANGASARARQVATLVRIAAPVLEAGARGELNKVIPKPGTDRDRHVALEALGRTLGGISPWLELPPSSDPEGIEHARLLALALTAIDQATRPNSSGALNFTKGSQALVDTAFLAQALLRAPKRLWGGLAPDVRSNVLEALRSTRVHKPGESNWLLFSAMVETALLEHSGDWNREPVAYAIQRHLEWYKGDGVYGDGPHFAFDYYNSFVIQPMLVEILEVLERHGDPLAAHLPAIRARAVRHAAIQERMISPEGTFPIIGRSSCYRFGALHMLSLAAWRGMLPSETSPASVRAALDAVIARMIAAPGTFDANGWLTVGVVGNQPAQAEGYINVGSVYLCTFGLLQLGLPPDAPFWTAPDAPWTQQRLWSGENLPADKAYREK